MARPPKVDQNLLSMALAGLEFEKARIESVIAGIKAELGGRPRKGASGPADEAGPAKRTISAAGKARIAAAQRRRWAALKASQPAPKKAKRRLSAEGRARIIAATKKRWAAYRKAKAQA